MTAGLAPIPFHGPREHHLTVEVVGVTFRWFGDRNLRFNKENLEQRDTAWQRVMGVIGDGMRRQKRERPEYWDIMSYLDRTPLPERLEDSTEAQVAAELVSSLARGRPRERTILELVGLPVIKCARARLVVYRENLSDPLMEAVVPRSGRSAAPGFSHDPAVRKGVYRVLEVDMTALGGTSTEIDWDLISIQALLVQLHAELELMYETGFRRLRRCERRACGAWFCAKRMDGRGRFCSTTCRVGNARDGARGKT